MKKNLILTLLLILTLFYFFQILIESENFIFLKKIFIANLETLAMSIVSTFVSFFLGILFMIIFNFEKNFLNKTVLFFLNVLRSIPEIIWALIILVIFGLGPVTGTIALTLHTTGIISRLYIDLIQNQSKQNELSLLISGNNRIKIFLYQTLPNIFSNVISLILYRWEYNIRASSVLGIVGAGGIGQELYYYLSLFNYDKVFYILVFVIINIFFIDEISNRFRKVYCN